MKTRKEKREKQTVFIRSDGWVISEGGMNRLKQSGLMGHERFMKSMEEKIGTWHRVLKPLDRDAAAAVKAVKGMVARAVFVSRAILDEAERCSAKNKE